MPKKVPMIGKRFGRLTIIAEGEKTKHGQRTLICKCDCGNITKPILQCNLQRTMSCGCLRRERLHEKRIAKKHDESNSRLYFVWQAMKQRCCNPTHPHYKHYGGRGIMVCAEWANSFEAFSEWACRTVTTQMPSMVNAPLTASTQMATIARRIAAGLT